MPPLLNTKLLDDLIRQSHGTKKAFCEAIGISENTPINWAKRETVSDQTIDMIVKHFTDLGHDIDASQLDKNSSKIDVARYDACMAEVQKIAERCGYPTDGNSLAKWASLIYQSGDTPDENQVQIIETIFKDKTA